MLQPTPTLLVRTTVRILLVLATFAALALAAGAPICLGC